MLYVSNPKKCQGESLISLLATKLHIPRPRPHLVLRSHLVEQLQRGMERTLTLISAPAGFGKTTLLAQWLAESGTPAAWVSLGPEDNDPTSFLSYVIAALQTLDAQVGATALALLRTPQPPPPEAVLAMLTNDLAGREVGDFALVLDDYHVITDDPIQRGMTFLLNACPRNCTSSWRAARTPRCRWHDYEHKDSSARSGLVTCALKPPK